MQKGAAYLTVSPYTVSTFVDRSGARPGGQQAFGDMYIMISRIRMKHIRKRWILIQRFVPIGFTSLHREVADRRKQRSFAGFLR